MRKTFDTLFIQIAFLNVIYNTRKPEAVSSVVFYSTCGSASHLHTFFNLGESGGVIAREGVILAEPPFTVQTRDSSVLSLRGAD